MVSLDQLAKEVAQIKERNARVELDKSWEISWFRRGLLTLFTYLAIGIYLSVIQIPNPWLNAIVPAVGFMLSTWSLPFFKQLWTKFAYKK